MDIYGIDPGTRESAIVRVCFYATANDQVAGFSRPSVFVEGYKLLDNSMMVNTIRGIASDNLFDRSPFIFAIEKIVSQKWSGKETSDAAIWSGIFAGSCGRRPFVFVTRARVRWELLRRKCGGDPQINAVLKGNDPRFPCLSRSILDQRVVGHGLAAIAVALAAYLNPDCLTMGVV